MNRPRLPCPLFTALVAVAAPAHAWAALPPSSPLPDDVPAEAVGDDVLAGQTGKYFGANMLVGVRVDLVSSLHAAQGTAAASGTLVVMRNGDGSTTVQVDTRSQASDTSAAAAGPTTITVTATLPATPASALPVPGETTTASTPAATPVATGGDLQINGIGQVAQIAGDGNRLGNTTTIQFVDHVDTLGPATGAFNGQTSSQASSGGMTAQVSFAGDGVQMQVGGQGGQLQQDIAGSGARILQSGQLAGVGLTASNRLQLQIVTGAMPTALVHQFGIQSALSGLIGVVR